MGAIEFFRYKIHTIPLFEIAEQMQTIRVKNFLLLLDFLLQQ